MVEEERRLGLSRYGLEILPNIEMNRIAQAFGNRSHLNYFAGYYALDIKDMREPKRIIHQINIKKLLANNYVLEKRVNILEQTMAIKDKRMEYLKLKIEKIELKFDGEEEDFDDISLDEAKQLVSEYLEEHYKPSDKFFPHEIARELDMSVFDIHMILAELEKDKEIEWE